MFKPNAIYYEKGIEEYMRRQNVESITELIGAVK